LPFLVAFCVDEPIEFEELDGDRTIDERDPCFDVSPFLLASVELWDGGSGGF
jgi:hypothetical protein